MWFLSHKLFGFYISVKNNYCDEICKILQEQYIP